MSIDLYYQDPASVKPSNFRQVWGKKGYDKVKRLYQAGFSIAAIAEFLGRTEKSVERVIANIKRYER